MYSSITVFYPDSWHGLPYILFCHALFFSRLCRMRPLGHPSPVSSLSLWTSVLGLIDDRDNVVCLINSEFCISFSLMITVFSDTSLILNGTIFIALIMYMVWSPFSLPWKINW